MIPLRPPAKISADLNALKANVQRAKHNVDTKMAQVRADELERETGFAIDCAVASIEQAGLRCLMPSRPVRLRNKRKPHSAHVHGANSPGRSSSGSLAILAAILSGQKSAILQKRKGPLPLRPDPQQGCTAISLW